MKQLAGFVLLLGVALAQVPAAWLGLEVQEAPDGTLTFRNGARQFTYVPGVGWAPPFPAALPPPTGADHRLDETVIRAAGLVAPQTPSARLRYTRREDRLRLVLDLPAHWEGPRTDGPSNGRYRFDLPYFIPNPPDLEGLRLEYRTDGVTLHFTAPQGRRYRWRAFPLTAPPRYVLDLYFVPPPPPPQPLAPGIRYREAYYWSPAPVKLRLVEAAPGSWRLVPVGRPGERRPLPELAPDALALLNGGYFDPPSGTPLGLWVADGVPIGYPIGRTALLWNDGELFAGIPRFQAFVVGPDGQAHPTGVNRWPARLTAYTLPGPAGRTGERVALVKNDRVVGLYDAPHPLPPGHWALAFPPDLEPWRRLRPGDPLKLYGRLEPPVRYALEAGPLLVQAGRLAYAPEAEGFRPGAPQVAKVTYQAAVAWKQDGTLWLVVSDPTTPRVLAQALLELGAWGAIRMDAGGSAQLYVRGRLVFPEKARPVVNGLALYPK